MDINNCSQSQPNVIWIFSDQQRAQALGCSGDPNLHTPNLDNLAALGVHMTGALSGFPLCCPFRGSLLTGKYPHKCVPGHQYQMPPEQPTIANVFNEAGYHTAYFGKWHLDGYHESNGRAAMHVIPRERQGGFQKWIGYENNNSQWDSWVHGTDDQESFHYRLPGYETDALTDLLIDYVKDQGKNKKNQKEKPFFAVLSVQPPHDPYVAPAEFMGRHTPGKIQLRKNVPEIPRIVETAKRDLSGAYAMIENLDWNLGRIREALSQEHLDFDTHIIFFSDHGDMHGSHGQFRKTSPYEESIRIPFIIGGEKMTYNGRHTGRYDVPLNHVDIAPTTLGLCGIDVPEWMEGTNYAHYRLSSARPVQEPDSAYLQSVIPTGHGDSVDKPWRGLVTRDGWKYVCFEGIPWLLFNLNEDPYEQANLAHNSVYKDQLKKLNDRLKEWIDDTDDSFILPAI